MEERIQPPLLPRTSCEHGIIKILIASPNDTGDARSLLIEKLERQFREKGYEDLRGYRIVTKCWEDLASQSGNCQDVIDSKILSEVDIVLALFKWKLGTPIIDIETLEERAPSGTAEELLYAIRNPKIEIPPIGMVYFFENAPQVSVDDQNFNTIYNEWEKLQEFKKSIQNEVIYKIYKESNDLLQVVAEDLSKNIGIYFKPINRTINDQNLQAQYPYSHVHQEHKLKFETKDNREIVMYWGYRPLAHNDIREAISESTKEIFISGIALTSICPVLNDPWVIKKIAANINLNPEFSITILKLKSHEHSRIKEKGGELLKHKLEISRKDMIEFERRLDSLVDKNIQRPIVKFLTYGEGIYPHHFILRGDDYIYFGSYLSHKSGSHSYLSKLRDYNDGLFVLFEQEIEYLKNNSSPLNIEDTE